jgi:AsmA family protein
MRWKWIILGFLGLVIIVFGGIYAVLSTYNFNSLKPQITRMTKERTGRELTLGGDIHLKIGLVPALVVENAAFQNAAWGSRPEMAKIRRFEMHVALMPLLSKRIELKKLILIEPDILLETDPSGRSNLTFQTEKKPAAEPVKEVSPGGIKIPSFTINRFEVTKGVVHYRDGASGKTTSLGLDQLALTAENPESPTNLKLKGSYGGRPIEAEGTVGPLSGIMDSGKPFPVKLSGKAFDASFTAEGSIKDVGAQRGIELRFTLKGSDLADFGKAAGRPLPLHGTYDFSGRLTDPAPKTYRVSELKASLGDSDAAGTVQIGLGGLRPKLVASLSSRRIDLRSMMSQESGPPTTAKGSSQSKTARRDRLFPADPLPLESLKQVDADVGFQAGEILLPQVSLTQVSAKIDLTGGRLAIKPFKAQLTGGSLEGEVDLQTEGRTALLRTEGKVDQLDVGRILKETKGIQPFEGRMNADFNLRGEGASVAAIMGSLNGKSVMVLRQGKVDNKYLDALGGDIGSGLLKLFGLSREASSTAVHCFVSGFAFKDGRADTTALVVDTDQISLIGEGEINLKNETLNLSLSPSPKGAGAKDRAGRIMSGLGDLARTFKLGGTFARPSLTLDTTQTAVSIGKLIGGKGLMGGAAVGESPPSTDPKLCDHAMEAARKGVKMTASVKAEGKSGTGPARKPEESIKEIGKQLQKFFGR